MRKGYTAAAFAIVGIAATIAIFATSQRSEGVTFKMNAAQEVEFLQFAARYGKSYSTKEEFNFRAMQYAKAKHIIDEKNSRTGITYRLGINRFADWTREEYKKLLGYKKNYTTQRGALKHLDFVGDLPKQVDWRDKNVVNDIQDQGQCGSCWAFSSVSAIEGHHAIKTGKLLKLSEQQLVDCAGGVYGNEGCDGGDMASAMNYTETHALNSEDQYPYDEFDDTCTWDPSKGLVNVTAINQVPPNNATQLLAAISKGPVSVAIEADSEDFQYYQWGILNGALCGTNLDHAVTAVGFDISDGIYEGWYIVRNSWGEQWGEQGYVLIAIAEGEGICGIQMEPVWPETN